MISMVKRGCTFLAIAGITALPGCAASPSGSPTTAHLSAPSLSWPAAKYAGRLAHAISYPTMQLSLTPPSDGDSPAISADSAYNTCKHDAACPIGDGGPVIVLALASSPLGGTVSPNGSTQSKLRDTLAYVLTWTDVACVGSGAGNPKYAASTQPGRCVWVVVVDATTGDVLASLDTNAVGG